MDITSTFFMIQTFSARCLLGPQYQNIQNGTNILYLLLSVPPILLPQPKSLSPFKISDDDDIALLP